MKCCQIWSHCWTRRQTVFYLMGFISKQITRCQFHLDNFSITCNLPTSFERTTPLFYTLPLIPSTTTTYKNEFCLREWRLERVGTITKPNRNRVTKNTSCIYDLCSMSWSPYLWWLNICVTLLFKLLLGLVVNFFKEIGLLFISQSGHTGAQVDFATQFEFLFLPKLTSGCFGIRTKDLLLLWDGFHHFKNRLGSEQSGLTNTWYMPRFENGLIE